jgi:hypothetical protein
MTYQLLQYIHMYIHIQMQKSNCIGSYDFTIPSLC